MSKFKILLLFVVVAIIAAFIGFQYGASQAKPADKTKPILTVAGIVYVAPENKYALIQRGKAPKGIAMFGGHVEAKESPETAFVREAKEELNVDVHDLKLIGLHGDYGRDPRQHSVEGTYYCTTNQIPRAGSDAKSVTLYSKDELIKLANDKNHPFAFDHREIIKKYFDSE